MSECKHPSLHVTGKVFSIDPDAEGNILVRSMHVSVHCRSCGMPFRFMGDIRPAPTDPMDFIMAGAPWANALALEMAAWITPYDERGLLTMRPEGVA